MITLTAKLYYYLIYLYLFMYIYLSCQISWQVRIPEAPYILRVNCIPIRI